jgi:hypothetical protein
MTVENVRHVLDAAALTRAGGLSADCEGTIRWPAGESVEFSTRIIEPGFGAILNLRWWTGGIRVGRELSAWTSRPDFRRWGFQCCGRLVSRVYFTRGRVGCRTCCQLGYESQKRSHARWRATRRLLAVGIAGLRDGDLIALARLGERPKPMRPPPVIELVDDQQNHLPTDQQSNAAGSGVDPPQ